MTSSWPDSRTLGRRVVIRYRTGGTAASGRPELSDVIGHIRTVSAEAVEIERRDGTMATVQRADTVTWKPVPDQRR